jgi:hypothetical protein
VLPGADAARAATETGGDQPQVVSSTYHTNSSREFVVNWYVEHLSAEFARQDSGPKKLPEEFRNSHISDDSVTFVGERGDQIRLVDLAEDDGGTKIMLLRSAKPAAAQSANSPGPQSPPAQ